MSSPEALIDAYKQVHRPSQGVQSRLLERLMAEDFGAAQQDAATGKPASDATGPRTGSGSANDRPSLPQLPHQQDHQEQIRQLIRAEHAANNKPRWWTWGVAGAAACVLAVLGTRTVINRGAHGTMEAGVDPTQAQYGAQKDAEPETAEALTPTPPTPTESDTADVAASEQPALSAPSDSSDDETSPSPRLSPRPKAAAKGSDTTAVGPTRQQLLREIRAARQAKNARRAKALITDYRVRFKDERNEAFEYELILNLCMQGFEAKAVKLTKSFLAAYPDSTRIDGLRGSCVSRLLRNH